MPADFGPIKKVIGYKPASRTGRFAYRIIFVMVVLLVLGETFKAFHALGLVLDAFLGFVLLIVLLFMGIRALNQRVLWKVRNRLILTYLLMGLSPIVLFATITGVAGWLIAGQYATNSAIAVLDETERRVKDDANTVAIYMSSHPAPMDGKITLAGDRTGHSQISLAYLDKGMWRALPLALVGGKQSQSPFTDQPMPSWLQHQFDGMISVNGRLYLCSLAVVVNGNTTTSILGSTPIDKNALDSIATGLGRIIITPIHITVKSGTQNDDSGQALTSASQLPLGEVAPILRPEGSKQLHIRVPTQPKDSRAAIPGPTQTGASQEKAERPTSTSAPTTATNADEFAGVYGGITPPSYHLLDLKLQFGAPFPVVSWSRGDVIPTAVGVVSRPTALYTRLFATSVNTGSIIRIGLIVIAIFFGLLELFSLFMAMQLSRTITESVSALYQGTTEIDRGNLAHRIAVKQKDQLGALSDSFNTMAESIQDLLLRQRENDRLLNELMIAQEVQKNLFPASPIQCGKLTVHALVMPARTVSGDYYDYIAWDEHRLCIALGDISGKGISAALLMASLNSAVRAFTLGSGDGETKSPSPAGLLTCLNRHLYRTTTPEKYATLFIAVFDSEKGTMTYSNGGHLPPLVLSRDGTVKRLETGGAVVGLLDGLAYEEATIHLCDGDLFVAYTDGLTEPERSDEEFGEDRLRDFVQVNQAKELDVLASESIGTVKDWIGNAEQPDDMTILLARYG